MNDTFETRVIFKKYDDEVLAFILDDDSEYPKMTFYAHIGQHGSCDLDYFYLGKLAKEEEYKDLYKELESIGYKLHVREKWIRRKK